MTGALLLAIVGGVCGQQRYKNPVLRVDYSDPDVCRVGEDFYMTASSFNCVPGLPVLHSRDLVRWNLVGHAIERLPLSGSGVNHGGGVWAPSIRHHDGWYWIFAPAGGVATGWQVALRSKSVFGPYERRMVMAQGTTKVNGPHQGAWVTTAGGEDWFLHFQDVGALGRIVHLQPMVWRGDWPVIGRDDDGDGCGEPVAEWESPRAGRDWTPDVADDELQWQWHGNPAAWWRFGSRLYSVPVGEGYRNLWDVPNLLLRKMTVGGSTYTASVGFSPVSVGERAGLVVMGADYGALVIENTESGLVLSQRYCPGADRGTAEVVCGEVAIDGGVYLRAVTTADGVCTMSYSVDGERFTVLGTPFAISEGRWIGAKVGLFCTRRERSNDGGSLDFEWGWSRK
jgi:beta-xylosidase